MIAVIDNYDSFTYNIVQYLGELGAAVDVFRNDEITVKELAAMEPERLLLSPGPGTPDSAGISMSAVDHFKGRIPILGVCLGHQSIGQLFGGKIVHASEIMHGKLSAIHHNGQGVFHGLRSPYTATRYHSLVVERQSMPDCLEVTAWADIPRSTPDAAVEVMGLRHKVHNIEGVQFHPESISSEFGHALFKNFLTKDVADSVQK